MQFLAYILVYPIIWLISILPFRLLYAFSDCLYVLLYHIIGYRKKTVKENLDLVFPNRSEAEKKRITKAFYHHLCDMTVEAMKSLTISEAEMKKRFQFKDLDVIHDLVGKNKSIALMCAHYGSWEWIFVLQTYVDVKGYAVYKKLKNPYFDNLVKKIRARYNSYLITTKETVPTLMHAKVNGNQTICGFVSDQSPKAISAHHWTEFMGIKVPVYTGAEMLSKRIDMSVVFFKTKRLKRGYYETTFELLAENAKDYENYDITDTFLRKVEAQIEDAPQYYLWTHKRWKHRDKVPAEFQ
ncbi:lysophospholipid acyltransferase family protein [Formosa algae]|uniref:KDO2-lipid IV(A) lauroyltransferase n=1 Tax=Formosa algae TaxID=225843 RepID=A0A9X1C9Q3_9FLAO|nr:lysophospholipid acyltransferase family protein [Formosa algae]MBP1841531.1 KDO2-lipid IV(A) lauroyltransferase [Formosa algae]MDQ0337076.1 KDO2-lipid IV(A) lauroyltransferase [Formosa algae]OEI80128.1 lipid A biosynthesis acyltransferase [Formosa algae]